MNTDIVYFTEIAFSETMRGRVSTEGSLGEIQLIEIVDEPSEFRFKWWVFVKAGGITH